MFRNSYLFLPIVYVHCWAKNKLQAGKVAEWVEFAPPSSISPINSHDNDYWRGLSLEFQAIYRYTIGPEYLHYWGY